LLGRALARSTGASHAAPAGAANGKLARAHSEGAIGENGAGAAEAAASEEQGEQTQLDGEVASNRTSGSPSPRAPARKRRAADGKDSAESASASGSSPVGVTAAPAGHAGHVATAAPPRSEKTALTGDGVARLASTLATRQPLATPSQAKPTPASATASSREKSREREAARAAEPAPAAARLDPPHAVASPQEAPATAREAAPRPAPIPPPPPGQDVQGAVLHHAAHLKVDAGALGSIELHLRLRDGALHLRVDGEAGRVVEARAGELSRTLAGEGLRLTIETPSREGTALGTGGDGGRQGEDRGEAWNEAADARGRAPATAPTTKTTPTVTPGGVHVTA
jgi:hypothetical protein